MPPGTRLTAADLGDANSGAVCGRKIHAPLDEICFRQRLL